MKIKTKRNGEVNHTDYLIVYIGQERYRITESIDGKMNVNKGSDGNSDLITVHPRTANEIELS